MTSQSGHSPTLRFSHSAAYRFVSRLGRPFAESSLLPALLLIIPALLPLAAPGYFFNAHDSHHSVFWLVEFDQALRDGALWPVWAPDHVLGFGYPLWLIYAPLAFYVAEAFHLLGLGFAAAVKISWAFWFILGAVGVFRLVRRWWGPGAALVAALAFTYAPYHLVDIYVRAAYAEFAALSVAPWALLGLINVWEKPGPKNAALAATALGALLLTHSMTPVLFVPLLGAFMVWQALFAFVGLLRERPLAQGTERVESSGSLRSALLRSCFWVGLAFGLGFGLSMIFWVPALLERRYLLGSDWFQGTYSYARHFVYPNQLFSAFWGFGYSVPGPEDGMSFQLGLMQWVGAVVAALAAIGIGRPALRTRRSEALFLVIVSLVAIVTITPATQPLWNAFPLAASVQFPWRLLTITTITLALLGGAAVYWLEHAAGGQDRTGPFVYLFALAIVLASFTYAQPELLPIRPNDESPLAVIEFETKYPDMRGMTGFAQRYPPESASPLLAQYAAGQPLQKAAIVAGAGEVIDQGHSANAAHARVRADSPVRLRFYTNFFPGWQATVDGQPVAIAPDPPDGLIGLDLPPGEHDVRLRFGATPVRTLGAILSLASASVVIGLFTLHFRRKRRGPAGSRRFA